MNIRNNASRHVASSGEKLSEKQAQLHYNLGRALVKKGDLDGAIASLQRALEISPDWLLAMRALQDLQGQRQKILEKATLQKATEHYHAGKDLLEKSDYVGAIACFRRAIEVHPGGVDAHLALANTLVQVEELVEAMVVYQRVLELQADLWEVHHKLGNLYRDLGRKEEAIAAYERSIALKSDFAWNYDKLADVLVELQEWQRAIVYYEKLVELQPDFAWGYYKLGEACGKLERWDGTVQAYRLAVKLDGDLPEIYEKLGDGLCHVSPQNVEEICRVYQQAIEKNPDNLRLYYQVLEVNPQQIDITIKLADILQKQGRLEQAVSFYKRALEFSPNDSASICLDIKNKLASIYQRLGYDQPSNNAGLQIAKLRQIGQKNQLGIVLFTPYYQGKNPERQQEFIYCLQKNIECGEIAKIVLLIDDGHEPELDDPRIEVINTSSRPTYAQWVELTQKYFSDHISILANTDVYLDESIVKLREIFVSNPNAFVAISRYEKMGEEQLLHEDPHWSQDVWVIRGDCNFTESFKKSLDIPLGVPRCDNRIAYLFSVHGYKVYNPCRFIKTIHVHETNLRYYDKFADTTILDATAWVYPSEKIDQPSQLKIDLWTLNPDDVRTIEINDSLIHWREERKEVILESDHKLSSSEYQADVSKINKFEQLLQLKFLSEIEKIPTTEGISLVTCCMNRNENLVISLETWLKLPEIDEIIIVDWNSNIPVRQSLQESGIKDDRILIARVIDQPRWILTFAYNVGLQLARYDKILKIDADNQITPDFFEQNKLVQQNEFFAGNWRYYQNKYLNGTFYSWKKQLSEIGYFNEYIQTYGWDDSDIYQRLEEHKFFRKILLERTMNSIKHGDELRLSNKRFQEQIESSVIEKIKSDPDYFIKINKFLANSMPKWSSTSKKVEFKLIDSLIKDSRQYELTFQQVTDSPKIPEYLINIGSEIVLRYKLREFYQNDDFIFDVDALQKFNDQIRKPICLIITLYNESNKKRCEEYLQCLRNNLNSGQFSQIVVLFENDSSQKKEEQACFIFAEILKIQQKYADILRIEIMNFRPTYDDIFEFANNSLKNNTIVVFANADIYFDDTLAKVKQVHFEQTFLVLSRRDLSRNSSLIREYKNKLPNYFSSDSWIFQTPLHQDFRANYLIGTFFCDSFLNNQLSKSSNYLAYNPCLNINSYHLHDESFNSSETKEKDTSLKRQLWEEEYESCNRSNPVAGYRWCTIEDVIENKKVYASPQIYLYLNIILRFNNINPVEAIIFIDDLLNLTAPLETKIWISSFFDFNFDNLHNVHSLIRNYVEYLQNPRLTCLEYYGECSQGNYYQLKLRVQDDWDNLLTNIKDNAESEDQTTVTELIIDYDCKVRPDMTSFMAREWNKSWLNQIAYTNPNLYMSYEIYNKIRETELNYKNSDKPRQFLFLQTRSHYKKNQPLISIVTSVYQGREFIQGFLENITKQTIFSQCELILIDGNSPENEGEIIKAFIRQKGFSNIHYHRLDKDPGLYECWNIAIRRSHGKYITNANLDDRRSPLHLEILANHLENNPQISAVSSALVVTYQPNEDWNFFTPDEVWFDGLSGEITFDDLYKYNNDILISRNTLHCMPLWKKGLHKKYGYFDESNYGTTADWEFWLRCSSQGEKYGIVGLPLGLYYLNPNSHNRRNDADGSLELRIINKYFSVNQEKVIKQ